MAEQNSSGQTRDTTTGGALFPLLLVDDEKAFVDALSFRLTSRGLPCLTACRGEDALAMLNRQDLEVVLLDLNMPGLHGLEVLRLIKARRPDVEVVLLTGEADFSVAATGMRRGAGDYLVKPVEFDDLLVSVNKARQRSRDHKERLRAAEAGKLIALGALAAGVGHEINNPLQIILHRSEWMQELVEDAIRGTADLEEMTKTAQVLQQQAKRAGAITAQLLELAHKSRSGKAETNLPELVARICGALRERVACLGVEIKVTMAPDLPLLPCSPAELEPVLSHLFKNALDAIEALRHREQPGIAAGTESDALKVSAAPVGDMVRITVTDTGEGIPMENAPHIYEPFFSTRPVGKGTGLGLTVCHSIITAMHGRLDHSNVFPRGTAFTVDIPAQREEHS